MKGASARAICGVLLAIILLGSLGLKLRNLGHTALTPLDEVFHAIVARNLLKHPLAPTLYETQYLDSDPADWQNTHIWMHKPPMALWQIAASFALLGETTVALRLPSALLATGAVWLTYLIGARLFGRRAGLFAAALQAFNPATFTLVQGYVFSDHVDVALLFWSELGIWFVVRAAFSEDDPSAATRASWLRSSALNAALAGVAQGFAFLSKTYPAFIVIIVLVVAWVAMRGRSRLRAGHVLLCIAMTVLVVAPWIIWCLAKFPREFLAAHWLILRHLHTDVERWAAPWDRLIFDYLLRTYHVFYPMLLAGAAVAAVRCLRRRQPQMMTLLAWLLGGVVPFMLATSKTPTGALVAWPAGWVLLGCVIDRALRGDAAMLGVAMTSAALGSLWPGSFPREGIGYPSPRAFAGVLRQNVWSLWHAAAAVAVGIAFSLLASRMTSRDRRFIGVAAGVVLVAAGLFLCSKQVVLSAEISALSRQDNANRQAGLAARATLPANAVILVDESRKLEHKLVMFWADRPAYPYDEEASAAAIEVIQARGGAVYVLSRKLLRFSVEFDDSSGRHMYRVPARR